MIMIIMIIYNDIAFTQLKVITRTRNKLNKKEVAAAERHLVITDVQNNGSKKQPFRICLPVKLAVEERQ